MNEARLLVVVVVSSLLIVLFFSFVLGYEDNADISDVVRFSKSCAPGTIYNEYTDKCKDLVKSNKRYFLTSFR